MKILTDHLRYLLFSEIYQRYSEPKTRRKAFLILENAIALFDKKGFENVTLLMIARESSLTPQTIRHYFASLNEIRDLSIKYIHLTAQKLVVDAMSGAILPHDLLTRYIKAHAVWATQFRSHTRVWLSFMSYSSRRKKDRVLNTDAIKSGTARITQLLCEGRKAGYFHHDDDRESARLIQVLMVGWLTSLITEENPDEQKLTNQVIQHCLRVAKYQSVA